MSLFLHTEVTAIQIIQKTLIFAGIGSYAYIYDKNTGELLKRINCLCGQRIYGFVPSTRDEHVVLVYGGKQFTGLVTVDARDDDEMRVTKIFDAINCDDWIHSAKWISHEAFALLTAHNVVQCWATTPTLFTQYRSMDNSILYSGLLVPLHQAIMVLAGTVYSEVIVHSNGKVLQRLVGHKGVIFSISCYLIRGIIVTTSDDRSVRIWSPNVHLRLDPHSLQFWVESNIVCKHELYGHTARVMRNFLTHTMVVSVGEDSFVCFWNYEGKLLKKVKSHQNSCIWSIGGDDKELFTGGGDGAIVAHPLKVITKPKLETFTFDKPKKVSITGRNCVIVLNETELIHFNVEKNVTTKFELNHKTSYKVMCMSLCRQMVAVTDMNGKFDIFVENWQNTAFMKRMTDTRLNIGKVLSMHWTGIRQLVFCTDNGKISVVKCNDGNVDVVCEFMLPVCKERWVTAAASLSNMYVVGDRCGNIHVYYEGQKDPVKSFNKVHGRYGPTTIRIKSDEIISAGRDGTVKLFSYKEDKLKCTFTKDLEFQWVEKFLDNDDLMVCGFQERDFVVYDLKNNSKMCEVNCGGGHRSWDAIRYIEKIKEKIEEVIKFVFLKNSELYVYTFVLSKIVSRNITYGSHYKSINSLKAFKIDDTIAFVSGGEDTTLRVSLYNRKYEGNIVLKHLSSIRTVKTYSFEKNKLLAVSGGGRAQICATIIGVQETKAEMVVKSEILTDFMVKGIDKLRKNNQNWRNSSVDFDPETRIMDLEIVKIDESYRIFAGCSDAYLRVFELNDLDNPKIELKAEVKYHKTCILKTMHVKYLNTDIIITCTTRGEVALWNIDLTKYTKPFFEMKTNKSGINSLDRIMFQDKLLIATGGDDNDIHLVLLAATDNDLTTLKIVDRQLIEKMHSSQISGLLIVGIYLITTSIDQRVTLLRWGFKDKLLWEYLWQTFSNVSDIQGMEFVDFTNKTTSVCVFGHGIEVIELPRVNER